MSEWELQFPLDNGAQANSGDQVDLINAGISDLFLRCRDAMS